MRSLIYESLVQLTPFDGIEEADQQRVLQWIRSGAELYRRVKPAHPPIHLVGYVLLWDALRNLLLLVDHKRAGLWLPPGGHVEAGEHPREAAQRECREELGITPPLLQEEPFFLTWTPVEEREGSHVDVTLWYLFAWEGDLPAEEICDEFHAIRAFPLHELPLERSDPHLHRFAQKLTASSL